MVNIKRIKDSLKYKLTPPIITKSGEAGAQELHSYIEFLELIPNHIITSHENQRLTPYFQAMEKRIEATTEPATYNEDLNDLTDKIRQDLAGPLNIVAHHPLHLSTENSVQQSGQTLSHIFETIAADTGSTLTSEFGIAPLKAIQNDSIHKLERSKKITTHFEPQNFGSYNAKLGLGFIQVMKSGRNSAHTFPMIAIDDNILTETLLQDSAPAVLESLRSMATAGNHDMLHHLTSTFLTDDVSKYGQKPGYADPLADFLNQHLSGPTYDPKSYESWALVSHATTWRELAGSGIGNDLERNIVQYYNALEKLGEDLAKTKTPEECHKIIDYYATAGGFILLRIMPMDNPLMQYALARMEAIDPLPDPVLQVNSFIGFSRVTEIPLKSLQDLYLQNLEKPGFINKKLTDNAQHTIDFYRYLLEKKELFQAQQDQNYSPSTDDIDVTPLADYDHRSHTEQLPHILPLLKMLASDMDLRIPDAASFKSGDKILNLAQQDWMLKEMQDHKNSYDLNVPATIINALETYANNKTYKAEAAHSLKQLRQIQVDNIRKQIFEEPELNKQRNPYDNKRESLAIRTMRNYYRAGRNLLQQDGDLTYKDAKIMDLLSRAAPEIPYLNSPDHADKDLQKIHETAQIVDKGVITLLSEKMKNNPA